MYNKLNLAITKIASKSSIKPVLASVAFYGNRTVATDSFKLVEMSAPGEAHEPVMISAKHLKDTLKMGAKDELSLEEIKTRTAAVEGTNMFDTGYPDVDQVLDNAFKREDDIKIHLNGKYMAEVADILSKLSKFQKVTMSVSPHPSRAITFVAEDHKTGQKARALLMPMNK